MIPARARSHSASNPMSPVVTSPSIETSSTVASNPLLATRPQAVKAGSGFGPWAALDRWNALRNRTSSPVRLWPSCSRPAFLAHSGSPNGWSSASAGSSLIVPMRFLPATLTCAAPSLSSRAVSPSTTCVPTVRPNRVTHAFGSGSVLRMVIVVLRMGILPPPGMTAPFSAASVIGNSSRVKNSPSSSIASSCVTTSTNVLVVPWGMVCTVPGSICV